MGFQTIYWALCFIDISENIANYINEGERKSRRYYFDYAKLKDSEEKVKEQIW